MGLPIIAGVINVLGKVLRGKLTATSAAGLAVGGVAAVVTGTNPFESVTVLIELGREAWPHLVIIVTALGFLAGLFRKAGSSDGYRNGS